MTSHNRALVYLRVSTAAQADKELPLETQQQHCLEFAQRRGFFVEPEHDVYSDRVSGRSMEKRTSLKLLIDRCKEDKTVKAIVIYDISRLSRKTDDYFYLRAVLKKIGVTLYSVNENLDETESPTGFVMEHLLATFAEFRSRQDGEKIKNSMRNKVLRGGWCGSAPYGYKNVQENTSSNKSKRWIEPNEKEAPWVKRCHELFATEEYTLEGLAEKLQAEGMPTRNGKKIHPSFVERILKKETYIGTINWGGVRKENADHQPLVPVELFERNRLILAVRNGGVSRAHRHRFLLRDVGVFCGECNSRITAGYHKGRSKRYALYTCTKKQKGRVVVCSQGTTRVDEMHEQLRKLFHHIEIKPAVVKRIREKIKKIFAENTQTKSELRDALVGKREAVKKAKLRLLDLCVNGSVEVGLYEEKKSALEAEERQVEKDLAQVEHSLKGAQEAIELALTLAGNCYRAYNKAPSDELRALLARAFFSALEIKDGIITGHLNPAFTLLIKPKSDEYGGFKLTTTGGDAGN